MEKYGVKVDDEFTKKASDETKCPHCGGKLEDTNPPICKKCGSAYLEPKEEK